MVKIAIDIDGVLINTMETYCEVFNEMYGLRLGDKTLNDVTSWEFYEKWGLPEEKCWEIFDIIEKDLTDVPFIDKLSSKYLRKLNLKHTVDIVTSRNPATRFVVERKLRRHKIVEGWQYDNLVILGKKANCKPELGYDIYVDDNPHMAEKMDKYPYQIMLLFDQPWNRHIDCSKLKNVVRVKCWNGVYKLIRKLILNWSVE